jgi:hypothetical protein
MALLIEHPLQLSLRFLGCGKKQMAELGARMANRALWRGVVHSIERNVMTIRAAVLLLFVFVVTVVPAYAQGRGGRPPNFPELADQVAALEARIARLEGNITSADLAGTYSALIMDTNLDGVSTGGQNASITTRTTNGTITLNADGTGLVSGGLCQGSRLTLSTGSLVGVDCTEAGTGNVTWTYADGVATITFLDDGDQIPLNVALGGRLLINGGTSFHASDPSSNHLQFILTRLR